MPAQRTSSTLCRSLNQPMCAPNSPEARFLASPSCGGGVLQDERVAVEQRRSSTPTHSLPRVYSCRHTQPRCFSRRGNGATVSRSQQGRWLGGSACCSSCWKKNGGQMPQLLVPFIYSRAASCAVFSAQLRALLPLVILFCENPHRHGCCFLR